METIKALMEGVRDESTSACDGCVPVDQAAADLRKLATWVGTERRRVGLQDENGEILAMVISLEDWENLSDALAVARNALDELSGQDDSVDHDELVRRLREGGGNL